MLRKQEGFQTKSRSSSRRNGSVRNQLLADEGERGSLQPHGLSGSAEGAGKGVEGTPQLQVYEVSNSTFHKIAARA